MTDTPLSAVFRFSRVPVWAIAGWLVVQTLTAIWWAAKMDERMSTVEAAQHSAAQDHTIIARLDERTINLPNTLERIDRRLATQESRR